MTMVGSVVRLHALLPVTIRVPGLRESGDGI